MSERSSRFESLLVKLDPEVQADRKAGRQPDLGAYARRHPGLAAEIREFEEELREVLRDERAVGQAAREALTGASADPPLPPGATVGNYEVLKRIGGGTYGWVYESRHKVLGKRVAQKVLKLRKGDPTAHERFLNDARTTAGLCHSNIVPVWDCSLTDDAEPYIAMQLIEGCDLKRVIEVVWRQDPEEASTGAARHATVIHMNRGAGTMLANTVGPDDNSLPAEGANSAQRARVELPAKMSEYLCWVARGGAGVADGLQHAHQEGVPAHRDVKPANLLVDASLRVWIADWGLVPGTPLYMAPEVVGGGEADARSDVFSLGVTLYELMTGKRPFDGELWEDVQKQILEQPPVPPRRHNPAIPLDLEAVVLKAMAKQPQGRYQSAAEMAEDLRCFLEGLPTRARPPRVVERGWRWAGRHQAVAALLVVSTFAVLGIIGGLLVYNRDMSTALVEVRDQRNRAEKRYKQTREVVGFMADVGVQELGGKPGLHELQRKVLQRVLQYCQHFLEEHGADPALKSDLAGTYHTVGSILGRIGSRQEALNAFDRALVLYGELSTAEPAELTHRRKLATTLQKRGVLQSAFGRRDDADASLRRALKMTMALAAESPDKPDIQADLAESWNNLGRLLTDQGEREAALQAHERALTLYQRLGEKDPESLRPLRGLATNLNAMALLQKYMGQRELSVQNLGKAANFLKAALRRRPESADLQYRLGGIFTNLALDLEQQGRFKDAEDLFREALDLHGKVSAANPGVIVSQHDLVRTQVNLGGLLDNLGHLEEGIALLRQAAAKQVLLSEANPQDLDLKHTLGMCWSNLASGLARRNSPGDRDSAIDYYRKALALREQLARGPRAKAEFRYEWALVSYNLGAKLCLSSEGRNEGIHLLNQARTAYAELTREYPQDDRFAHCLTLCHVALGDAHKWADNNKLARGSYQRALDLSKSRLQRPGARPAFEKTLGDCYNKLGILPGEGPQDGFAYFEEARKVRAALLHRFPDNLEYRNDLGQILVNIGLAHERGKHHVEAVCAYTEAEKHYRLTFSKAASHDCRVTLSKICGSIGALQRTLGHHEKAVTAYLKVAELQPERVKSLAHAAKGIAGCIPLANDPEQKQRYSGEAIELLRRALAKDADVHRLLNDPAFKPLISDERYRKLINEPKRKQF